MKQRTRSSIEKDLEQNHECYVLITCDKPTGEGNMQVEMTFGGVDPFLASYLLKGAQNLVEKNLEEECDEFSTDLRQIK